MEGNHKIARRIRLILLATNEVWRMDLRRFLERTGLSSSMVGIIKPTGNPRRIVKKGTPIPIAIENTSRNIYRII